MATFAKLVENLVNAQTPEAKKRASAALNAKYNNDVRSASKGSKKSSSSFSAETGIPETIFDTTDPAKALNAIVGGMNFDAIKEDYKDLIKIQKEFIQQGGQHFGRFAEGQEFNKAISQAGETMFKYFGNIQQGQRAFFDTSKAMKAFVMVNNKVKNDMATTVGVANELGISTETMTGIFDTAIQSFGATGDEAVSLGRKVANMSQQLAMSPQELASNFAKAQKSLLYDSGKVEGIFRKLQFTSRATGVSFDSLTSAFGSSMDTFQGSSEKAGKLNAILGKSVFNSIDLLGKSESERLETIVGGVRKNLRGGVQNLGKFELQSIASGLGMTPDETRRLLSGKTTVEEALKTKAPKDPREKALQALAVGAENVDDRFSSLIETLDATRDPIKRAFIDVAAAQRNNFKGLFEQVGGPLGFENPMDVLGFTSKALANTDLDPAALKKQYNAGMSLFEAIKGGETERAKEMKDEMEAGSTRQAGSPGGRRTDLGFVQNQANKAIDTLAKSVGDAMSGWTQVFNINVDRDDQVTSDNKVDQVKRKANDALRP
jgi:hypothetical protein